MANTKKYVSLDKLGLYDEKIKKYLGDADAAVLAAAIEHANGLSTNYDQAGASATVQANLDEEIARAKAAEEANAAAAKKAQDEVDALELVVEQIQANAYDDTALRNEINGELAKKADKDQVALDIAAAVKVEEDARKEAVAGVQGAVDTLSGTHATDKAALEAAISGEAERATGVEEGLANRIKAVEDDHLVAADKTALEGAIALKASQEALDAEIERATGVEEGLQNQINTIMNNPDAEGAINSINEFTAYIAEHGEIADGFNTAINKNKDDIAAEKERAEGAEAGLAGRLTTLEAINHNAYVAADEALSAALMAEINKKADTTAVEALEGDIADLEAADTAMAERMDAVEAQLGDGEGSVADLIEDAMTTLRGELAAEIEGAKSDASSKDAAVLKQAQDGIAGVQTNLDTHTGNADIHVTADDKTKWNAAVQKADVVTGTSNGTISVQGKEVAVAGLGSAAYAATTAFDAAGSASAAETAAKAHADSLFESFVECSQEDINALFTA